MLKFLMSILMNYHFDFSGFFYNFIWSHDTMCQMALFVIRNLFSLSHHHKSTPEVGVFVFCSYLISGILECFTLCHA